MDGWRHILTVAPLLSSHLLIVTEFQGERGSDSFFTHTLHLLNEDNTQSYFFWQLQPVRPEMLSSKWQHFGFNWNKLDTMWSPLLPTSRLADFGDEKYENYLKEWQDSPLSREQRYISQMPKNLIFKCDDC